MKKLSLGVLLGGVVYFAWCALTWIVLPIYSSQIKRLPEETLIRDTLKVVLQEPGLFEFPSRQTAAGKLSKAEFQKLWTEGPVGILAVSLKDPGPINTKRMGFTILGSLLTSLLIGWILFAARKEAFCVTSRLIVSAGLGLMVWVASDFIAWNWWSFPTAYTFITLADRVIGFALVGLTLSGFIPKAE